MAATATGATGCAGSASTAGATGSDQPGVAADTAAVPRSTGTAGAAVAPQNPTRLPGLSSPGCAVGAVADQGTPYQDIGGIIDDVEYVLLHSLVRQRGGRQRGRARCLGPHVRRGARTQRLHKRLPIRAGPRAERLKLLPVVAKCGRYRCGYLIGGGGLDPRGLGRSRRMRRVHRRTNALDIHGRRVQQLWNHVQKGHAAPFSPMCLSLYAYRMRTDYPGPSSNVGFRLGFYCDLAQQFDVRGCNRRVVCGLSAFGHECTRRRTQGQALVSQPGAEAGRG